MPLTVSCQSTLTLAGKPARLPKGCNMIFISRNMIFVLCDLNPTTIRSLSRLPINNLHDCYSYIYKYQTLHGNLKFLPLYISLYHMCLTTTYAISAYHHWCCEFESRSGWCVEHYVIKFVSDLWQVQTLHGNLKFLPLYISLYHMCLLSCLHYYLYIFPYIIPHILITINT
jgi:hypothetical protein